MLLISPPSPTPSPWEGAYKGLVDTRPLMGGCVIKTNRKGGDMYIAILKEINTLIDLGHHIFRLKNN